MDKEIKIRKKELQKVVNYKPKTLPTYSASIINLVNGWAKGTDNNVVGQMTELVEHFPYKDYDKWRKWYLKEHPYSIDEATKLIMAKLKDVAKAFNNIDEKQVRIWVDDLVIDKSFWGLKIQEAIILKLQGMTGEKCRLANAQEESKGIDGFIGKLPVQIKPSSYKTAINVKKETLRAKTIYYNKEKNGDYTINLKEIADLF